METSKLSPCPAIEKPECLRSSPHKRTDLGRIARSGACRNRAYRVIRLQQHTKERGYAWQASSHGSRGAKRSACVPTTDNKPLQGHFLMPSFRQADFMAVAEMPSRTAASCRGKVKSWRRIASFSTTGLLLTRVRSPALRRGKMVLFVVAPSSALVAVGGDGVRVGASFTFRRLECEPLVKGSWPPAVRCSNLNSDCTALAAHFKSISIS